MIMGRKNEVCDLCGESLDDWLYITIRCPRCWETRQKEIIENMIKQGKMENS